MIELDKNSLAEPSPQGLTGQTLDQWTWILRARDAARRATESPSPPPERPDEGAGGLPDAGSD
jgi:hypothetical protein